MVYRSDDGTCYDPDTHEYWRETPTGRRDYISVTQAIHEGGLADEMVVGKYTESSRDRGTALHDGLLFYFTHKHEPLLDDEHVPYWRQVMRFLGESGFVVERAEDMVVDDVAGYAGRFDFVGTLPVFRASGAKDLIDVKSGSMPDTVRQQTMGYRRRLKEYRIVRRWALVVTPVSYGLVPLNSDPTTGVIHLAVDRYDERLFLAAVEVARHRRKRGFGKRSPHVSVPV